MSFILNGNGARFPETTRQRVLAAAKELDYKPSLAGRSLASGRSDTIVILLPNMAVGSNLQDVVDEAMAGTAAVGGNVVVRFAGSTPKATMEAVLALRPAGVINLGVLSGAEYQQLEQRGILALPRFVSDSDGQSDGGVTEVQARVLLERGCRAMWSALLGGQRGDVLGPNRVAALRRFCAAHGLPEPKQVSVPVDLAGAIAALETILAGHTPGVGPLGVACFNDDVAMALLAAARELGVRVPERIALIGVDRSLVGQLWTPRLTTIDVDLRGMVARIAAELRSSLGGGEPPSPSPRAADLLTLVPGETA